MTHCGLRIAGAGRGSNPQSAIPDPQSDKLVPSTQFAAATGRKYAGRQQLGGGTLGIDLATAQARAVVKELDAVVTK